MKTCLRTTMIALPIAAALAAPAHALEAWQLTLCEEFSKVAGVIMAARQSGYPMPKLMRRAEGDLLTEAIILDAYDVPVQPTDQLAADASVNFSKHAYRICVQKLHEAAR